MSKHKTIPIDLLDDDMACRVVVVNGGKRPRFAWEVWQRVEHGIARSQEDADLQIGAVRHGVMLYNDLRRREFLARVGRKP